MKVASCSFEATVVGLRLSWITAPCWLFWFFRPTHSVLTSRTAFSNCCFRTLFFCGLLKAVKDTCGTKGHTWFYCVCPKKKFDIRCKLYFRLDWHSALLKSVVSLYYGSLLKTTPLFCVFSMLLFRKGSKSFLFFSPSNATHDTSGYKNSFRSRWWHFKSSTHFYLIFQRKPTVTAEPRPP